MPARADQPTESAKGASGIKPTMCPDSTAQRQVHGPLYTLCGGGAPTVYVVLWYTSVPVSSGLPRRPALLCRSRQPCASAT